jgi:hypothetical protein
VPPVPLREGGEDCFCGCTFGAAVAAGGIREFFGGEASVSSRMRNRLTTRRDWDILVWVVCLTYSTVLYSPVHSNNDDNRRPDARANSSSRAKNTSVGYVRVVGGATPASAKFTAEHYIDPATSIYCKQHKKASDDIIL